MTFYLKYRPQTINELDLDSVRQQLTQVLGSGTVPHAFLFAGPRGLGKTSAARILAKAINCLRSTVYGLPQKNKKQKAVDGGLKATLIEPCNQCEACLSISAGRALDMIEIDGASNRGIDDVRELRERIKLVPAALRKKIYVIDEVHMLTKEAFNALLKTLEEPPEHAVFVLATTEPEKLPATIISRCFVIEFKRPSLGELKRALQRVVTGEKLKVAPEVLELIAASADGSFRDAVKNLEQLAFAGATIINRELFDSLFQKTQEADLLAALRAKDVKAALIWISEAQKKGRDWKTLLQALLNILRDKLLAYYGVGEAETDFTEEELKTLIKLFFKAAQELKGAPIPHLPLELAVVEYCKDSDGSEDGRRKTEDRRQRTEDGRQKTENRTEKMGDGEENDLEKTVAICDLAEVQEKWEAVLQRVKPQNHSVEALLRSTRPTAVQGRSIVIEVFYEFHKGRLETEKCRVIVENSLRDILGQKELIIDYILGDRQKRMEPKVEKMESGDNELVQAAEEIFRK